MPCTIEYASLEFARRVGFDAYLGTYYADPPLLLGDRAFARALFGDQAPSIEEYWCRVALPFTEGLMPTLQGRSLCEPRLQALRAAEEEAVSFVEDVAASPAVAAADVIGLSSTFGQHVAALAIARRVKALYPEKTIILGGANCEGPMGRQTLRSFPFVDYVSSGPADVSFPAFVKQLAPGRSPSVAGILGRGEAAAESGGHHALEPASLDDLPYPDYSDFFAAYERLPGERRRIYSIPVEGARGCWWGAKHHCIFCGINGEQMPFRRKSARRFHAEINHLVRRYGARRIWATDNILEMSFLDDLMPLLEEERDYEEMFFEVKASLRKPQLAALARAGITRLQPGIESLDTSVLRLMKKGTTTLQNLQLLKWAEELGIALQWNIICGFPGEEPQAYRRMYEVMKLIPHLPPPKACSQITIDRFSPIFNDPAAFNVQVEPAKAYRFVYPLPAVALKELAYFHSQRSEVVDTTDTLAVPPYAAAVFHQAKIWQGLYRRTQLRYSADASGSVEVIDTRPGAECERRELTGLDARVLVLADSAVAPEQICAAVGTGAAAVADSIERLQSWKYVYCESGKVLALATRAQPEIAGVPPPCQGGGQGEVDAPATDGSSRSAHGARPPCSPPLVRGDGSGRFPLLAKEGVRGGGPPAERAR